MSQTTNNATNNKKGNRIIKSNLPIKQKFRIRNRARITPWCNSSEFDYVGLCLSRATLLFPNGDDDWHGDSDTNNAIPLSDHQYGELVYGIERITHWRTRAQTGRLPHSVDMCASIAEIMLNDALSLAQSNTNSGSNTYATTRITINTNANAQKLSYASAIIRAVNGIADSIQKNRATYGSSISHLCSQIGLPSWIVDLRHDSAHNELPTLIPLRLAAKTLLGFLMEKYWTVLEDLRIGWREEGVGLLVECKSQCKALDRIQMEEKEVKAEQADHDGDDDDDKEEEDGNFYGAYSIFMEDKKKKKKGSSPKTTPAKQQQQPLPKPQKALSRTARQCLNEFIKTIPMDMGLPIIIQYLIGGGIGDAPHGRGILIPGSPSLKENMSSVRKMRERYSLILLFVANKWPGFVHMLFVNIVDLMISLDGSSSCKGSSNGNGCEETDTNQDGGVDDEVEEAGKNRKIFFLKYWIQYLLSNEFYCFLHWHDIVWRGSKNIRQRPREKWSEHLLLHMESSAPLDILKRVRIPLNSVCDRFSEGESDMSKEMSVFLEGILGKERVRQSLVRGMRSTLKRSIGDISNDDVNVKSIPTAGSNDNERGGANDKDESYLLGLEEIEGLLSDEERTNDGDSRIPVQVQVREREESKATKSKTIVPWTLCQSWEPCAIGTLPGYA